jgi:hypothetical protein
MNVDGNPSSHLSAPTDDPSNPAPAVREVYAAQLRMHAVTSCALMKTHAFRHEAAHISNALTSASAKERIREVMKSVTTLEASMPIAWHSSVHVAVDENRQDVMRLLILPDQETAYANGAFLFDMLLPATFPEEPPKVRCRD